MWSDSLTGITNLNKVIILISDNKIKYMILSAGASYKSRTNLAGLNSSDRHLVSGKKRRILKCQRIMNELFSSHLFYVMDRYPACVTSPTIF